MVMAGERARLTEKESYPEFLWCNWKWDNCASVKTRSPLKNVQLPTSSTCFLFQYPFLYGESADHTMSRSLPPLFMSMLMMPKEVAMRGKSHQLFTSNPDLTCPSPPHHYDITHTLIQLSIIQYPPAVVCAPATPLYPSDLFYFPVCVNQLQQHRKNASLVVYSATGILCPLPNILTILILPSC